MWLRFDLFYFSCEPERYMQVSRNEHPGCLPLPAAPPPPPAVSAGSQGGAAQHGARQPQCASGGAVQEGPVAAGGPCSTNALPGARDGHRHTARAPSHSPPSAIKPSVLMDGRGLLRLLTGQSQSPSGCCRLWVSVGSGLGCCGCAILAKLGSSYSRWGESEQEARTLLSYTQASLPPGPPWLLQTYMPCSRVHTHVPSIAPGPAAVSSSSVGLRWLRRRRHQLEAVSSCFISPGKRGWSVTNEISYSRAEQSKGGKFNKRGGGDAGRRTCVCVSSTQDDTAAPYPRAAPFSCTPLFS